MGNLNKSQKKVKQVMTTADFIKIMRNMGKNEIRGLWSVILTDGLSSR